nr:MAG TPA: hypothetical protein [Caudoviricetes sp.]
MNYSNLIETFVFQMKIKRFCAIFVQIFSKLVEIMKKS